MPTFTSTAPGPSARVVVALILGVATFASAPALPDPGSAETSTPIQPRSPAELVLELLDHHPVVFLGEYHRIADQIETVAALLPDLHRAGVRHLGWEFARAEDQPLIDRLLGGETFDEGLATELLFRFDPFMGFEEYRDVYRAAWRINAGLDHGEIPFRILGLNASPDWSHVHTPEDRSDPEVMARVFADGDPDPVMARFVEEAILGPGHRAVVYCGYWHAMTAYRQPAVVDGAFVRFVRPRLGNRIEDALHGRAATVLFHMPWVAFDGYGEPEVVPVSAAFTAEVEAVHAARGGIGFITAGPVGATAIEGTFLLHGYDGLTLADVCDGYLVTAPLRGARGVTPIPGIVSWQNLDRAKAAARNPRYRSPGVTPEAFMATLERNRNPPAVRWTHLVPGSP